MKIVILVTLVTCFYPRCLHELEIGKVGVKCQQKVTKITAVGVRDLQMVVTKVEELKNDILKLYAQSPFCPPLKGLLRGAISSFSRYSLCHNTPLPAKMAPGHRRCCSVRGCKAVNIARAPVPTVRLAKEVAHGWLPYGDYRALSLSGSSLRDAAGIKSAH